MRAAKKVLFSVSLAAMCVLLATSDAMALAPPTQVSPAGDYVKLVLGGASFNIGDVHCTSAASEPVQPLGTTPKNKIPTTNNPTTSGPISIPIRPLAMTSCTAPGAGATATGTGLWRVIVKHKATGDLGKLKIAKAGLVVDTFAPGSHCTVTVAPGGPAVLRGTWTNGSPSGLSISGNAPGLVGGDCAAHSTLVFISGIFAVNDTSNGDVDVVVS